MFLYMSTATLLSGCPQLLSDEFQFVGGQAGGAGGFEPRDAGDTDQNRAGAGADGPSGPGDLPDASALPAQRPDASTSSPIDALRAALAERYSFDGTGEDAIDSSGGANGQIYNASLDGSGFVRLTGSHDSYVSLPSGLLSSGSDRTVEVWLIWRGGGSWQRIFDFGMSDAGALEQGSGTSYLFLTPRSDRGAMQLTYSRRGLSGEVTLHGSRSLPTDTLVQVAVAVDSIEGALSLYVDGILDETVALTQPLSSIVDDNAWIGRSQFAGDPGLVADVFDFRIYNQALDAQQIALSYELGSDSSLTSPPE